MDREDIVELDKKMKRENYEEKNIIVSFGIVNTPVLRRWIEGYGEAGILSLQMYFYSDRITVIAKNPSSSNYEVTLVTTFYSKNLVGYYVEQKISSKKQIDDTKPRTKIEVQFSQLKNAVVVPAGVKTAKSATEFTVIRDPEDKKRKTLNVRIGDRQHIIETQPMSDISYADDEPDFHENYYSSEELEGCFFGIWKGAGCAFNEAFPKTLATSRISSINLKIGYSIIVEANNSAGVNVIRTPLSGRLYPTQDMTEDEENNSFNIRISGEASNFLKKASSITGGTSSTLGTIIVASKKDNYLTIVQHLGSIAEAVYYFKGSD